jgi:beta-phosphoglucomutase-like phosphatase (HAD superfamily)
VIRAVLFDFDGLIVDTELPTYTAWRDAYKEFGVDLALEDYLPAVGTGSSTSLADGGFDAIAHLETLIGKPVDRDDVVARRLRRKRELCGSALLLPGVVDRLAEARELGLLTAIVTRNSDDWVEGHCSRIGLEHPWDLVVCANDTPTMDKAELYRRALGELGVDAGEAIAIEDSPPGIDAAKAAGLYCVAVPNEVTRGASFAAADRVCGSLEELSLADLAGSIATD